MGRQVRGGRRTGWVLKLLKLIHSQERSGEKLIEEIKTHPEDVEPMGEEDGLLCIGKMTAACN